MGFFSKKTYVCEKCGAEFEKRININGNICDKCLNEENAAKANLKRYIGGYCSYALDIMRKEYTSKEMQQIIAHRDALLEKFRFTDGISREELRCASDNYKSLTDEEAASVLIRASRSEISATMGAAYSDAFFVLTNFDGIIVDADDVFAVGMTTDPRDDGSDGEAILCAAFTNDPYVPVFPITFIGKKDFFEFTKSKKGREEVKRSFETMCHNLTYPVCDLKELKKMLKKDGTVKGKLDNKYMLELITYAMEGSRIFNTKNMYSELSLDTASMMDSIGYIQQTEINRILKMDKMLNRNYWNKQIERLSKRIN